MNEEHDFIIQCKNKKIGDFFQIIICTCIYTFYIYIKFIECKWILFVQPTVCTNINYLFRGLQKIDILRETWTYACHFVTYWICLGWLECLSRAILCVD
jgi:hypothetical protein